MKFLKENRIVSFLVVTLVYVIATCLGIVTYTLLNFDWWLSLLIADIVATIVTFVFSLIFNNSSVYDPYWSVQPIVILIAFATQNKLTLFAILTLIVVLFWGVRLTANWAYTFLNLNHQDWRYTMLKEKTGMFYPLINFLGIHLVPTLVVYACILPGVYVIINEINANFLSVLFLLISLMASIMQGVADIQMHKFRKNKKTTFISFGLWKYSRHPNYLGEILMWWGIALSLLCAMPSSWYLILGAIMNTALFLFVSIPMADKRQSQKDGFAEYKARTRMLLPIKK